MNSVSDVPFVDLWASYEAHREEFDHAISSVLSETSFVLGEAVVKFEQEFASYCDCHEAVGCGNGTDALELVLEAAGISRGDEVITVGHTFAATLEAIVRVGARPVLVDVDPHSLLMDPDAVASAITSRTVGIIPVHLYGSCAPMDEIVSLAQRSGLLVIEDAAQAHGASYQGQKAGSMGDAAAFSFYPGKNLGAFGDAGAVVTNQVDLARKVRRLRDHGKSSRFIHTVTGRNSRLDTIHAAVLSVKLKYLDEENARRSFAWSQYCKRLEARSSLRAEVKVPLDSISSHHLAVFRVRDRQTLLARADNAGVQLGIHYPIPAHRQPAFQEVVSGGQDLAVTEEACDQIVSLPLWPFISTEQQERVVDLVAPFLVEAN